MGKLTISMAIFNSFLYVYQRVNTPTSYAKSRPSIHLWNLCARGWADRNPQNPQPGSRCSPGNFYGFSTCTRPGKHTKNHGKSPCWMGFYPLFNNGHGFQFANCKRLPEGNACNVGISVGISLDIPNPSDFLSDRGWAYQVKSVYVNQRTWQQNGDQWGR